MKSSTHKARVLGISLFMVGCTATYLVDYVDASTGEKPDPDEVTAASEDCHDAWRASKSLVAPPATSSAVAAPATTANTSEEMAIELALTTMQLLSERRSEKVEASEFREECMLSKGLRQVLTPL